MFVSLPDMLRDKVAALGIDIGVEPEEGLDASSFAVDLRLLTSETLDNFYELLKAYPNARGVRVQINAFRRANDATPTEKVTKFQMAATSVMNYIVTNAINGWIFKIDENPIPALVTSVDYHPAVRKREFEREAYISVSLMQNDRGSVKSMRIEITQSRCVDLSPEDILAKMGWLKETDELISLYQEELERYKQIRPMFGKQLVLRRPYSYEAEEDDGYNRWGQRRKKKTTVDLKNDGQGRLVHNQPVQSNDKFEVSVYERNSPDNPYISLAMTATIERLLPAESQAFTRAPYYMVLDCYHLSQHTDITVHVRDVEPYVYDKSIRERLILSDMYNEVLDVLTHDMLLVQEDIVAGKTGGNVILLAGPPGLGKTLTAEVYAEFREVPLLKIHSGQLGTHASDIEGKLMTFYQRATAWGIPVLLDEFDVFGRARGNSLEQNAVVAVFLRTLEYQNNTLFLTTNRADDMDDAILSRCAAIIKYDNPPREELKEIWKTQRDQLLPSLTDDQIDELMSYFWNTQKTMTGRDVKNIMKLADRYEKTGRQVTVELLKTCAGFRGV